MSRYLLPSKYLPHDSPMLLLEEVLSVTDETACCSVRVSADGVLAPFIDAQGHLPGWFALELMAQTVGVWSGWHRHQTGESCVSLGMVLGARSLVCAAGHLPGGKTLIIHIALLMQDERFGSFECTIETDGKTLATGRVNTFQPTSEEMSQLFQQGTSA